MSKCRKGTYQNSNSDDRAAKSLHKVRTGSGSDRVVSEKLNDGGQNKSLPFGERMIAHAYRLGRYRVVSEKLNDGGHNKSSPFGERMIAHAYRLGRYRVDTHAPTTAVPTTIRTQKNDTDA